MHTGTGLASPWYAEVGDRRLRLLALAVLCSLVLHACVLLFLSYFRYGSPERAVTPPLTARLVKPRPPEPVPALVEPRVQPQPPRPTPVAKAQPQFQPQPRPAPAPSAPPPMSVEPAKQAAEPMLVVPAAPAQPAASADVAAAPAPAAAASGPDPGSIARFRLELMDIARRYKKYPRIARENNWQGRVELRIAFSASGSIAALNVKKGAGHAVLDEEAQAMIRNAQPQAAIPPALRGKAFTLEIPVDFFLTEEEK
jgi:protein TonB